MYRVYTQAGPAVPEQVGEYTSERAARQALRNALGVSRLTSDTPAFADEAIAAGYAGDEHDEFGWIECD